jgi:tetratricopeptide (TPR) repeat protein
MLGTRLAIIAAAGACLGSIVIPLGANSEIHQSQAAFSQGRLATALGDARSAARLEPYAATPWLQQALVLESAGHLAAAEAAARRAEHNESANWREPLILARIQAERREVRASRASARRAFRLNPSIRQYLP